jgi:hypothetical protein
MQTTLPAPASTSDEKVKKKGRADPGVLTDVLDQFLRRVKGYGFNSSFFGVDIGQR